MTLEDRPARVGEISVGSEREREKRKGSERLKVRRTASITTAVRAAAATAGYFLGYYVCPPFSLFTRYTRAFVPTVHELSFRSAFLFFFQ